ncbi:MAG: caspase family protein [Myxococcota bacterium]
MMLPLLAGLAAMSLQPEARSYALSLGNNAVPSGERDLETLRFADDDALRFHQLFSRFATKAILLTVFDETSHRRSEATPPPTEQQLARAVAELERALREDRSAGRPTTLYLFFSGHGGVNDLGEPYLALVDGELTRARFFDEVLDRLAADRVHVIVDACNAGAVVGLRGGFDEAREATAEALPRSELEAIARARRPERYPHVGFLVAAASGRAAHEWSRLGAGVFSYEVFSALSGGADVNADGRIEYSEVEAFVGAANSGLRGGAQLTIRTQPPAADRRAPLFDLSWLGEGPFLVGQAPRAMRLSVEAGDGERYWDAHLAAGALFKMALPSRGPAFLRSGGREARLPSPEAGPVPLETLVFSAPRSAERGAADDDLRRGLFLEPFGPAYYRGFADSRGRAPVPMAPLSPRAVDAPPEAPSSSDRLVLGAWVAAATTGAVALVAGGLALERNEAFHDASTQREAAEITSEYELRRDIAIGSGIAAGTFAAVALILGATASTRGLQAAALPRDEGWEASVTWSAQF